MKYWKTSAGSRSAELPAEDDVRGAHFWSNGRNMCWIESTLCSRARPLWEPTSGRSRLVDHGTISSRVCCRDAKRQRSNSDAQSITCPVFGRRAGTSRLPPEKRNHTARRDAQRAHRETHSCRWRTGAQRGQKRGSWRVALTGNWPPHRRLWSELATAVRLERHVSQAARMIRCSCGAEVSLWISLSHHKK